MNTVATKAYSTRARGEFYYALCARQVWQVDLKTLLMTGCSKNAVSASGLLDFSRLRLARQGVWQKKLAGAPANRQAA